MCVSETERILLLANFDSFFRPQINLVGCTHTQTKSCWDFCACSYDAWFLIQICLLAAECKWLQMSSVFSLVSCRVVTWLLCECLFLFLSSSAQWFEARMVSCWPIIWCRLPSEHSLSTLSYSSASFSMLSLCDQLMSVWPSIMMKA